MRDSRPGVRWVVGPVDAGARLDRFLASDGRLGSRARARRALERGKVFVNDREATLADSARQLHAGDDVRLWDDRPGSRTAPSRPRRAGAALIVFEDQSLLVVNKPAGLLVVPVASRPDAATVEALLARHLRSHGKVRPLVVHRIDRDTSGLVVFAKNSRAQQALKAQFEQRTASRVYLAIVHGHPEPAAGTWHDRLAWSRDALMQRPASRHDRRGKDAVSHYRVLRTFEAAALVEVTLESGRRNQIRAQATLHGHSLVGERKYADKTAEASAALPFPRQALHAWRLGFNHPMTGRRLQFEAPLASDLEALVERLSHGRHQSARPASLTRAVRPARRRPVS
jgi:23S rRNA pseudouridine1911/1915/1917 synthase